VRRTLRLAAYQLLMLDRVPAAVAIDEAVTVVRENLDRRRAGFVNAVLRKLASEGEPPLPDPERAPRDYLVQATSLPPWIAKELRRRFGDAEAVALARALVERPPLTVRANRAVTDRDRLAKTLAADHDGARCTPTELAPEGLVLEGVPDPRRTAPHREGALEVQDEGSQLIAHLVGPRPGERVLDACAGRGGKTLHLAALAGGEAALVAADLHGAKLEALARRAARAGGPAPELVEADLTADSDALRARGPFDRVLLDAPCTGLGVLRRHPEAKWRLGRKSLPQLAALQAQLLDHLADHVAPDGLLVYAVCTVTTAEGPAQIARFLERRADFEAAPPPADAGVDWKAAFDRDGPAVQTLPHRHGCDGFFMVRMRRR
jgi:16S rRNA (cytosine967-C5)-methyltransferase